MRENAFESDMAATLSHGGRASGDREVRTIHLAMPYHPSMILLLALLLLASPAQPSSAATAAWLGRSAELALACVHKEYPTRSPTC